MYTVIFPLFVLGGSWEPPIDTSHAPINGPIS
jgi:hypothetical protein